MDFVDIYHDTNERVKKMLKEQYEECTDLERFGLDHRSALRLYVSEEGIIVYLDHDRILQYYGGFEYVEHGCRMQLADWVFYSIEDDRVREHVDHYFDRKVNPEEDE